MSAICVLHINENRKRMLIQYRKYLFTMAVIWYTTANQVHWFKKNNAWFMNLFQILIKVLLPTKKKQFLSYFNHFFPSPLFYEYYNYVRYYSYHRYHNDAIILHLLQFFPCRGRTGIYYPLEAVREDTKRI